VPGARKSAIWLAVLTSRNKELSSNSHAGVIDPVTGETGKLGLPYPS
jgi:hypothetical protein